MRPSISAICFSLDDCASAEMYAAPSRSSSSLMAASSVFQRSSWKFDQLTPTTRSWALAVSAGNALPAASRAADIPRARDRKHDVAGQHGPGKVELGRTLYKTINRTKKQTH